MSSLSQTLRCHRGKTCRPQVSPSSSPSIHHHIDRHPLHAVVSYENVDEPKTTPLPQPSASSPLSPPSSGLSGHQRTARKACHRARGQALGNSEGGTDDASGAWLRNSTLRLVYDPADPEETMLCVALAEKSDMMRVPAKVYIERMKEHTGHFTRPLWYDFAA